METNYKEKYEAALERAKDNYNAADSANINVNSFKNTLISLFPELAESEDEKIRKALIFHFQDDGCLCNKAGNIPNTDILAWLEKQGEQTDIANKEYWGGYREGKKEMLDKYTEVENQSKKKHKFNIGDIISNGQAVFRVDNIIKNCIGQDCYFLVNVEYEKKGIRYLVNVSHGNRSYFGEITWLCEQVDESFEKQGK